MRLLKSRLPPSSSILPVFAVISFLVYGWMLIIFFWKVPSWLMFLTLDEILVNLAYVLAAALLESLAILGLFLLVCILLPAAMMKDVFVTRGTVAALIGLGSIMLYMYIFSEVGYSFLDDLLLWTLSSLALTLLLTVPAPRLNFIVRLTAWTSDRVTVFVYLFLPLSALSLLVVISRNLF
ncbi:MAG: hypothetical protein HY867_06040 [Chloroflexi bacterium]|nr:hypothetical protein [Chloroflexota bacterium]